jgi:hypothetical protein
MRPVHVDQPMRILEEVLEVLEFGVDEARVDGEDQVGFLEIEVEGADEVGEGAGVVVVVVGVELGDAEGGEGRECWGELVLCVIS